MNQDILKYTLGLKIKKFRTKRNLSLKKLAELSGFSTSYLNEIEKGKKYPKMEKLIPLASNLEIPVEELVSPKVDPKLGPIIDLLNSKFFQEFPFELFGVGQHDFFELTSQNPEKFSSFLAALMNMARIYELNLDEFYQASLRSYQESHKNYFPELEDKAEEFLKRFKVKDLEKILQEEFNVSIDYKTLNQYPNLASKRSVLKGDTLYINNNLRPTQKRFVLAKQIGYLFLNLETGTGFTKQLNDFKASYFSGALLIDKKDLIRDLKVIFKNPTFKTVAFFDLLQKYGSNTELLFNRLTQILPQYFNFNNLFFLRLQSSLNPTTKQKELKINKELHFAERHFPHGIGLPEHYCRRWITVSILGELEDKIKAGKYRRPLLRVQISQMTGKEEKYLCVSMARKSSLKSDTLSCLTIGMKIDDSLIKAINFLDDPKIRRKIVGQTCERCDLADCKERACPPVVVNQQNIEKLKKDSLAEFLQQ
ncbi:MAG: helix-turn-helix domain-containing protein [Deltaproteobacteria bacterium]|nr:MAG: helix-turn-helix domain-containing protein [Deltaproteobacteria bacterium]